MSDQKTGTSPSGSGELSHAAEMGSHYVGRGKAVKQLLRTLTEHQRLRSKVVIQSIEGPGGIGKTALFEHVLAKVDRADVKLLTMRVGGAQGEPRDPFQAVQALVASCETPIDVEKPLAQRFSNTDEVRAIFGELIADAKSELQRVLPDLPIDQLMRLLRASVEFGQRINTLTPRSKDYLDFDRAEQSLPKIEDALNLTVLKISALWRLLQVFCEERHGTGPGKPLRAVL